MTNYQINYDPNGDDLGRAEIKPISPLEFRVILPHVAHILECLYVSGNSKLPYKYAFEFLAPTNRDIIFFEMQNVKLPPHVKFYECDGKQLFEMRGQSGGVVSGLICYLVTEV